MINYLIPIIALLITISILLLFYYGLKIHISKTLTRQKSSDSFFNYSLIDKFVKDIDRLKLFDHLLSYIKNVHKWKIAKFKKIEKNVGYIFYNKGDVFLTCPFPFKFDDHFNMELSIFINNILIEENIDFRDFYKNFCYYLQTKNKK